MIYVLDASAIIAYLRREPGGLVVKRMLIDVANQNHAHSINLAEIYYDFMRSDGEVTASRKARKNLDSTASTQHSLQA